MPARRAAAVLTAAATTAVPAALLGAAPAHAARAKGKATAAVLRADLDVSSAHGTTHVPLHTSLNEVQAPAAANKTALTVELQGVDNGRPFDVLRADAATARATADRHKAEGHADLARAKVHVPGLPLLSLIEVEQVTSKALCEAGKKPVAETKVLGSVRVLGKRVTLRSGGTTRVAVPGVGEVRLDLSETATTTRTAAATALDLKVAVDPLELNVAEVKGRVKLAESTCEAPQADPSAPPTGSSGPDTRPQSGSGSDLAETGGDARTPYVAAGAAFLLGVGGALLLARRRKPATRAGN